MANGTGRRPGVKAQTVRYRFRLWTPLLNSSTRHRLVIETCLVTVPDASREPVWYWYQNQYRTHPKDQSASGTSWGPSGVGVQLGSGTGLGTGCGCDSGPPTDIRRSTDSNQNQTKYQTRSDPWDESSTCTRLRLVLGTCLVLNPVPCLVLG